MECLSPVRLYNESAKLKRRYNSDYRYVPCGKCPACIDKQRKFWYVRLREESEYSFNAHFITLTYDEASIPRNSLGHYTFNIRHVQLFMKRLRKALKKYEHFYDFYNLRLRYFIIGEYGSKFGRPHYHGILFNIPNIDLFKVLSDTWKHGRISCDVVTPKRISYVANYMYGKSDHMPDELSDETNKLPVLSSRKPGIGSCYLTDNVLNWHRDGYKTYYQDGNFKYPIPRFWLEKIFDEDDKSVLFLNVKNYMNKRLLSDIEEMSEFYQKYGTNGTPPSEQRRNEFLRKFYNRRKKHENSNKHYNSDEQL